MSIEALLKIAKSWKHPKCPKMNEQTFLKKGLSLSLSLSFTYILSLSHTHTHIHTNTHTPKNYSDIKKNKIMSFAGK
jgi:hypothetical protein